MSQPGGPAPPFRSASTTSATTPRRALSIQVHGQNQRATPSVAITPVASTDKENAPPLATRAELIKVSL
jgi:hypothetical protein